MWHDGLRRRHYRFLDAVYQPGLAVVVPEPDLAALQGHLGDTGPGYRGEVTRRRPMEVSLIQEAADLC